MSTTISRCRGHHTRGRRLIGYQLRVPTATLMFRCRMIAGPGRTGERRLA